MLHENPRANADTGRVADFVGQGKTSAPLLYNAEILWEVIGETDPRVKFRVTGWNPQYRDIGEAKGMVALARGLRGPEGSWIPMFEAAKVAHPDRAAEFDDMIRRCRENQARHDAETHRPPPTAEELEDQRLERMSSAVAQGLARSGVMAQPEDTAPAEAAPKRTK